MVLAGVHRPLSSTPDLERRLRELLPPLGLKASPASPPAPPYSAPTPSPTPSPAPSRAPSPSPSTSSTPLHLHELAARQARLDAALRGTLQGDADLQAVRARRRELEERQRRLESELQVQRQILQGSAVLGISPDAGDGGVCERCLRAGQRERRLRLQEQQLERLRAQTEAAQEQLRAQRTAHTAPTRSHQGDAEFSWLGLLCCCC